MSAQFICVDLYHLDGVYVYSEDNDSVGHLFVVGDEARGPDETACPDRASAVTMAYRFAKEQARKLDCDWGSNS